MKNNLVGRKVETNNGSEGIIKIHEKDEISRDIIRIKVTKGYAALTDYFLKDVKLID